LPYVVSLWESVAGYFSVLGPQLFQTMAHYCWGQCQPRPMVFAPEAKAKARPLPGECQSHDFWGSHSIAGWFRLSFVGHCVQPAVFTRES